MWVWPSVRCPLGRFVLLLASRAQKRVCALYRIVGAHCSGVALLLESMELQTGLG